MKTQKPISVRMDLDVLHVVEQEKFRGGLPANRIINLGALAYCRIMDSRRRYLMFGRESEWNELVKQLQLPYPFLL